MNNKKTIHLVAGISSVGKSSFIESKIKKGEWNKLPLIMASELERTSSNKLLNQECIVHYNLFRPYNNQIENLRNDFVADSVLVELLKHRQRIRTYLLVAHRAEVIKRCLLRTSVEPRLRGVKRSYPQQQIFELLSQLDLNDFYNRWFLLLRKYAINFEIINCEGGKYMPLSSTRKALKLLSRNHRARYSSKEIDYIIKTNKFEYQKMKVSPKRSTRGQDRSGTLEFLDKDLRGKSVLDIGCAYGYFCFEAEKRNAARVVGTELKRHRFIGCNILKEIYGRNSEFLCRDIFEEPLKEKFDLVLFLNVIHHLKEPVRALRIVSKICKEKLIMEFPTLSDKKFRSTLPWWWKLMERRGIDFSEPLIGVSLFSKKDQTFLFSKKAIKRILLDHERLFSRIEFHQSPMSRERSIAVCYK